MHKTAPLRIGLLLGTLIALLPGCGGGGSSDAPPLVSDPDETSVGGSAVKGPLVGAAVTAYAIDLNAPDLKGRVVGEGTTNDEAQIVGLTINARRIGPFIVEFEGGTELGTNISPVLPVMQTVMTQEQLASDKPIYATPLSTLALELAATTKDQNGDGFVSAKELELELKDAQSSVKQAFGLGLLNEDIDLFSTPPVYTDTNDATEEESLNYRIAGEVFASLLEKLATESGSEDLNELIGTLIDDWTSDGAINGKGANGSIPVFESLGVDDASRATAIQSILATPANSLPLPGQPGTSIADISQVMAMESKMTPATQRTETRTMPVIGSVVPGEDGDGDGIIDENDKYPEDPLNNDSDSDGVEDPDDACPFGPGSVDNDNDSACAGSHFGGDYDDSNANVISICEDDSGATTEQQAAAGCFINSDTDDFVDPLDRFPFNGSEWADQDGDCGTPPVGGFPGPTAGTGCGDNSDPDIDGDGTSNESDFDPLDPLLWADCDNDGIGEGGPNNNDDDEDTSSCIPTNYEISQHKILPYNADGVPYGYFVLNIDTRKLFANLDFNEVELGGTGPSVMEYSGYWEFDLEGETLVTINGDCEILDRFGCTEIFSDGSVSWPLDGNQFASVQISYDASALLSPTGTTITITLVTGDGQINAQGTTFVWTFTPVAN